METNDRPLTFDQLYIHAETDSRRVAIVIAKANALWLAKYPNSLPSIEFYDSVIKDSLDKETMTRALGQHHIIESERIKQEAHDLSRNIMVANQKIERFLKLDHL
jgi:hypothetical protein